MIGVRGNSLNWFSSYLSNRSQIVEINNTESDLKTIDYGVIQGSTLGPVLFLIYINNLSKLNLLSGEMYLFADDTCLLFEGNTWEDTYSSAERGLCSVKQWFDRNRLSVNASKTKHLAISLRASGDPVGKTLKLHTCGEDDRVGCQCEFVERVEVYKYLGIIFDCRLTWKAHVQYLNSKLRKSIFLFSVFSRICELNHLKTIYFAYVQSILQFGIIAWGAAYKSIIYPLQVTQKSILKAALMKPLRYPTSELFKDFQVLNIRQLFVKSLLQFSFHHNFDFLISRDHKYSTRFSNNIGVVVPRVTRTISKTNPYYLAHILYLNLPPEIRNIGPCSRAVFKRKINEWLFSVGRHSIDALLMSIYSN